MKENTKRIMLIVIMILSILGIILTINHAKNNLSSNNIQENEIMEERRLLGGEQPNKFEGVPTGDKNQKNDGEPPELPNNQMERPNNNDIEHQQEMKEILNEDNKLENTNKIQLTLNYKIIIVILFTIFCLCLLYLLISINNSEFYKNKDKLTIYILSNIILIYILSTGTIYLTNNYLLKNDYNNISPSEKDEITLNKDNVINDSNIDLEKQTSDITITKGGVYTLTGKFNHSILVDAKDEEVELILNNVEIKTENTATIIGLSASKITINLADNSNNLLIDAGNSEYDGCIFSNSELIFEGNGSLVVNGNQNEGEGIATEAKNITFNNGTYTITSNDDGINAGGDGATITFNGGKFYIDASGDGIDSNKNAIINGGTIFVIGSDIGGDAGIDTDDGFTINGGTVIALGSDMIETPLTSSKQKSISFTLNNSIQKDTIVTLMNDNSEVISFQAPKSFQTIIISSKDLENSTYSLYTNGSHTGELINGIYTNGKYTKGEKISINNIDNFTVNSTVNNFGNSNKK